MHACTDGPYAAPCPDSDATACIASSAADPSLPADGSVGVLSCAPSGSTPTRRLLRAADGFVLLRRGAHAQGLHFAAWQLALAWVVQLALLIGLGRLEVPGPANFYAYSVFVWCGATGLAALLIWLVADQLARRRVAAAQAQDDGAASTPTISGSPQPMPHPAPLRVADLLGFVSLATLPAALLMQVLGIVAVRAPQWLSSTLHGGQWLTWVVWGLLAYALVVQYKVFRAFLGQRRTSVLLVALLLGLTVLASYFADSRFWYPDHDAQQASATDEPPPMALTQDVFDQQEQLLQDALARLAPGVPGKPELYGIVYAPYGSENVFLNEAHMVTDVLQTRFAAAGRLVALVNHASATATMPWATPRNLRKTLRAMQQKMNPGEDVLVIYMTSHGGTDAALSSRHDPLTVDKLRAAELAQMLREARVGPRVLIVSACYSGSWLADLQHTDALVMTAADAEHTSYGCGTKSELTYFGRALFDEQLRHQTRSFEHAFGAAVPIIRQREEAAGKEDGFSNPQISVGPGAERALQRLQGVLEPRIEPRKAPPPPHSPRPRPATAP